MKITKESYDSLIRWMSMEIPENATKALFPLKYGFDYYDIIKEKLMDYWTKTWVSLSKRDFKLLLIWDVVDYK